MPTSDWRFVRMTGVKMKTLTYLKDDELCEIILETHAPHEEHQQEWKEQEERLTHLHIKLHAR